MGKLLSVFLCLLMIFLSSCGDTADVASDSFPPTHNKASSKPAGEVDYSYMHELAGKYDIYSGGRAPRSGQLPLILGILDEYNLKSGFVGKHDTLNLKKEEFEKISKIYFSDTVISDYDEESSYSWYYDSSQVALETFEIAEEAGGISALYGRFVTDENNNRHWLYPVKYFMERHTLTAGEIPEFMQKFKNEGDQIYRIIDVINITDMDQAQDIYNKYGYEELMEEKRYTLTTPEDIVDMAARVNSGLYREVTATYSLVNDIDMSGVNFSPIGTNQAPIDLHDERNPVAAGFNGTVEGNGLSIRNLSFTGESKNPDGDLFGFFAVIGNKGYIKDLRIENASISYKGGDDANVSAGILAGSLRGGTIENTFVSGDVEGTNEVGGLCGYAGGDFWSPGAYQEATPPGIIDSCRAEVNVRGIGGLGGLVGTSHRVMIENSHAKGVVTTESPTGEMGGNVGGLAGHNVWATISGSSAEVQVRTVTAARCVGSFVGLNEGDIYNCFFLNTLSKWKPSGDSPRNELSNDVVGLDKKEFDARMEKRS